MTSASDIETALRKRLRKKAHRSMERALVFYTRDLRAHVDQRQAPTRMDSYFAVLRNAHERAAGLQDGSLAAYAAQLVQVVTNLGRGIEFPEDGEFLALIEQVALALGRHRHSTVDLWLECARYVAQTSVGSARRAAMIDRAIAEAHDDDERLRALRTKASYYIDISAYRDAHRALDRCDAIVAADTATPGIRYHTYQLAATRGVVYFYRNEKLALEYFRRAIASPGDLDNGEARTATAGAIHFTGRIQLARGHPSAGLACLILAENLKEPAAIEGTQVGFYHLRVGEVLVDHRMRDQGMWHFEQAGRTFHAVRQRSTAEAQLDAALARVARADGDLDRARALLDRAIQSARRDAFIRGEVMFRMQMIPLQLRTKPLAAVASAFRIAQLTGAHERSSIPWLIRQLRRHATGLFGTRAPLRQISCPCPAHDALSTDELWELADWSLQLTT
jgi:tetratricopeptide (TPR) repeat protein